MAKPPKKIPITSAPDTSVEVTRIVTHEPAGHLPHTGGSDPIGSIIRAPHSDAGNPSPNANQQPPGVTISNLPETVAALLEANMRAITWPAKNAHLLRAISNPRGLYESPDGDTYAHIADEGYFRVDRQADGRYRVHWPEGLGEAGPLLTQVEGQAYWRPAPSARPVPAAVSVETAANPSPPRPLPADQAAWLTNAQTTWDGMRYDKRKATYVDMEDGTTFMVRKHPEAAISKPPPMSATRSARGSSRFPEANAGEPDRTTSSCRGPANVRACPPLNNPRWHVRRPALHLMHSPRPEPGEAGAKPANRSGTTLSK